MRLDSPGYARGKYLVACVCVEREGDANDSVKVERQRCGDGVFIIKRLNKLTGTSDFDEKNCARRE